MCKCAGNWAVVVKRDYFNKVGGGVRQQEKLDAHSELVKIRYAFCSCMSLTLTIAVLTCLKTLFLKSHPSLLLVKTNFIRIIETLVYAGSCSAPC